MIVGSYEWAKERERQFLAIVAHLEAEGRQPLPSVDRAGSVGTFDCGGNKKGFGW